MANWAKLQEDLTGLPVVKRARHGIHFDKGNGEIVANFSGKPCHFQDTDGLWKPIDTKLLLGNDGFYGCPHSPVKVHKDGRVKVDKSNYSQFTKLPGSPIGKVDGDRIVREFPGGYQELFVTEDGFREVITVNKRTFPIEKFIGKTSGTLPSAYKAHAQTAVDANGDVFEITSDTKAFGDWMEGAVFPVTIDPDFAGASADAEVYGRGVDGDWATARSTTYAHGTADTSIRVGYEFYLTTVYVLRSFFVFDTSAIGSGSTVTQVNLKLTCTKKSQTSGQPNFDVQIVKYDWSSYNPISKANREIVFDGCLAADTDDSVWKNTADISAWSGYTSGNLSTTWVNKSGSTYYGLRSSLDDSNTLPESAVRNDVSVAAAEYSTESYRPVLTVTYTAGSTGALRRTNMNAQMQSLTGGFN